MTVLQIVLVSVLGGLVVIAIALTPVWIWLYRNHVRKRVMGDLAARLNNGHMYGGNCFEMPQLVFEDQGQRYHLRVDSSKSNQSRRVMHVTGPWPGIQTRITVFPETFWTRAQRFLGMEDHQIGVAEFDDLFVLQANSIQELKDIIRPDVQQLLTAALQKGPDLNLSVCGGQIGLSVVTDCRNLETMHQRLDLFLELRRKMLGNVFAVMNAAQRVVAEKEMTVVRVRDFEATCMVCGTDVTEYRVQCRRCKTPHHKDCWGYFGGCSRYGCGESSFFEVN